MSKMVTITGGNSQQLSVDVHSISMVSVEYLSAHQRFAVKVSLAGSQAYISVQHDSAESARIAADRLLYSIEIAKRAEKEEEARINRRFDLWHAVYMVSLGSDEDSHETAREEADFATSQFDLSHK